MAQAQEFHSQLISHLPRMRIWALALTSNRAEAEDLVQDVAAKALAAEEAFTLGTNFSAWVHRIMINHFITGRRHRREFSGIEDMPETPIPAAHEDHTALRELSTALHALPAANLEALSLIVLQERSYEDAAAATGQAVGTLKSRVHRARAQLRSYLVGESSKLAA